MSLADFFIKQCTDKLKENVALLLAKLSDPMSLISFNVSDALANAAKGEFGDLSQYAENYIEQNADTILLGAINASGLGSKVFGGIDLIFNMMASAMMLQNDLALVLLKQTAKQAIVHIDNKLRYNAELKVLFTQLYNALSSLAAGDPVFDAYLAQLREGLALIHSGRTDIRLVRNTLEATNSFLAVRYKSGREKIDLAKAKIKPLPPKSDYLRATASGLGANLGIPTRPEQIKNTIAIPVICKKIITVSKSYFAETTRVNGSLVAYFLGLEKLKSGMPGLFKGYVLGIFDGILSKLDSLAASMALNLNGSKQAISYVEPGYSPAPLKVSVHAFKWGMDLSIITPLFKTVPEKTLGTLSLSQGPIAVYESTVKNIKKLNTVKAKQSVLIAFEGQEDVVIFQRQVLNLLIQANTGIATAKLAKQSLSLVKSFIARTNLVISQDTYIRSELTRFINTPLPLEDNLNQLLKGLMTAMKSLGLDRAADILNGGDFSKFFGLNAKNATYVGAALEAVAFLKTCFPNPADVVALEDAQNDLEGQQDLLNISVSFNFDFAIKNNIRDCVKLKAQANLFLTKENLCSLFTKGGIGKAFDKLEGALSFSTST